jgi:hypothetical protein
VSGGPVLIKWLEQLLDDRAHLIRIAGARRRAITGVDLMLDISRRIV